ncbi:MAG: DUF177 domain-containing protein [Magnetococcales bacterium]|nr:DUF177 domain-containing protein [Magnetococcales bacterium]
MDTMVEEGAYFPDEQFYQNEVGGAEINLARFSGDEKRVRGVVAPERLSELDAEVLSIAGPTRVSLRLTKSRGRFRVVGTLSGLVDMACGRCLAHFRQPLECQVDRLYVPKPEPDETSGEHRMDEDVVYLADALLSVRRLVEEELLLVLPMRPLCGKTCKGLCSECGVDLNQATCDCRTEDAVNPFAALKALKLKS